MSTRRTSKRISVRTAKYQENTCSSDMSDAEDVNKDDLKRKKSFKKKLKSNHDSSKLMDNIDIRPTSCTASEGTSDMKQHSTSNGRKENKIEDGSSSDSSDEFCKVATNLDLNSDFFHTFPESVKKEAPNEFENIESNILSGATSTLTDSESEVEYTEVNWPCITSVTQASVQDAAVGSTEMKNEVEVKSSKQRKKSTKKLPVSNQKVKKETDKMDVLQLLKLGEGNASSSNDVPLPNKHLSSESEENLSDMEEVALDLAENDDESKPHHTIPKEGVQITLELPELQHRRKKKDFDMEAYLLRQINNRKRAVQVLVHKVSLLCWIAHGNYVNSILNSQCLLGVALSLIPSQHCYPPKRADLNYMEQFLKWFHKTFSFNKDAKEKLSSDLLSSLHNQFNLKVADSQFDVVLLFICVLRSLGIKTRLILSLQPAPLKLASHELCTVLPKKTSASMEKTKMEPAKHMCKTESKIENCKEEKSNIGKLAKNSQTDIKSEEQEMDNKSKIKSSATKKIRSSSSKNKKGKSSQKNIDHSVGGKQKCNTISKESPKSQQCKYFVNKESADEQSTAQANTSKYFNAKGANSSKSKDVLPVVKKLPMEDSEISKKRSKYFCTGKEGAEICEERANLPPAKKNLKKIRNSEGTSEKSMICDKTSDNDSVPVNNKNKKITRTLPMRSAKTNTKTLTEIDENNSASSDLEPEVKRQRKKTISTKSVCPVEKKKTGSETKKKKVLMEKPKNSAKDLDFKPDEENNLSEDTESSNDSDFKPQPIKKPRQSSGCVDRRVLSTDDQEDAKPPQKKLGRNKKTCDIWAEVFLEAEEKWFSVDVGNKKVHCHIELQAKATQPVLYVVAFNSDLTIKEVTRRYVVNWSSIKQRIDEKWWEKSLKPFIGRRTAQDREEDEELSNYMLNNPLPTVIGEYKHHPLYVLQRHLLKFEAIYPPDTPTLGFVRSEAVYPRECVHTLHSRDIWLKEAKVVKLGEKPYKVVKARPKYDKLSGSMITDQLLEVFGSWQLQDYEPPEAENGIVPRNEYGNVDLYKPCMLPKGCAHLPISGLSRVARKLGIDCAPAIVGFDFHSGGSHPLYDGYIVCAEFRDILVDAWNQEVKEAEKRANERLEKRVYDNWKRIIKGVMIRERLKARYAFGEPSTSEIKTAKKGSGRKQK